MAKKQNSQVLKRFNFFHWNYDLFLVLIGWSLFFRMHSLKTSCDHFPTSLILLLTESKSSKASVVGHSKISPMPRFPNACFIESGNPSYTIFSFKNLSGRLNKSFLSAVSCHFQRVSRTRLGTLHYARSWKIYKNVSTSSVCTYFKAQSYSFMMAFFLVWLQQRKVCDLFVHKW